MLTKAKDVVCTFCGCLCDDIILTLDENRIVKVERACANGMGLFKNYNPDLLSPKIRGKGASWEKAIKEASEILSSAKYPLIYGLSSTSSEAQRVSVKLAEALGASIDSTSSVCHGPTGLAMQFVGEPTCTLGEIKNRADLLIFWGCNPIVSHSRHFARYSV
ncbi:MAG TPA: formylmethanofuran dehydrogenase subunit B, partial [Acetomicrobium sp.]|nr:formylmethanofuran dehydrogenase subunit B [Acetomicrobium sp.]